MPVMPINVRTSNNNENVCFVVLRESIFQLHGAIRREEVLDSILNTACCLTEETHSTSSVKKIQTKRCTPSFDSSEI